MKFAIFAKTYRKFRNTEIQQILKINIDYFILGKFHQNICIFEICKGGGQFFHLSLVQVEGKHTLFQIGLYSTLPLIGKGIEKCLFYHRCFSENQSLFVTYAKAEGRIHRFLIFFFIKFC